MNESKNEKNKLLEAYYYVLNEANNLKKKGIKYTLEKTTTNKVDLEQFKDRLKHEYWVRITFEVDRSQLKKLYEVEDSIFKLNIVFDTGHCFDNKIYRDWELDWSFYLSEN
jgi:hypothetical protein